MPAIGVLNILSWNVELIGFGMFEAFLEDLSREIDWGILLLQEFTASSSVWPQLSQDGHSIYIQPPCPGRRCSAIIVKHEFSHLVVDGSFESWGRACSLTVSWSGWRLKVVSSHLDPGHSINEYQTSIDDIAHCISFCRPPQTYVVLGVDAQDSVGPSTWDDLKDDQHVLGEYCELNRGEKGELFMRFCLEHWLKVYNTWFASPIGTHTCHYHLRHPPKQIDHIGSNLPKRAVVTCGPLDSTATVSDHRPNCLTILGKRFQACARTDCQNHVKPIRRKLTDPAYNTLIRNSLKMPKPFVPDTISGYHIYTDGSATKHKRKVIAAGWSFVLFGDGPIPGNDDSTLLIAMGPAVVCPRSRYFLGAKHRTNNTAELSALLECFLFILGQVSAEQPYFPLGSTVHIHTDSKYCKGVAEFKFNPQENVAMAMLLQHLVKQVGKYFNVALHWVAGHSNIFGNELADKHAKQGASVDFRSSWWTRPYRLVDWDAQGYRATLSEAGVIAELRDGVIASQCSRPPRPPPKRQLLQEQIPSVHLERYSAAGCLVPSLGAITDAISNAGRLCGKGSRLTKYRLASDHPLIVEMKQLESHRRQTRDPVHRQSLSLQVCRLRRKIRTLTKEEACKHAISKLEIPGHLKKHQRPSKVFSLTDYTFASVTYDTPDAISDHVTDYFSALFCGEEDHVLPSCLFQRWSLDALGDVRVLDGSLVKQAAFCFKPGKTCADDMMVSEMLALLGDDVFEMIAEAFQLRLLNALSEDDDASWDEQLVKLLKKKVAAKTVKHFRPIAVIPVLSMLYSRVLLFLAGGAIKKLQAPQFAFRRGYQAHEVIFILRNLIEKSLEWQIHLFVLDGDLHKAYDFTRHTSCIRGLQRQGVPNLLIAGWMREVRRESTVFVLDASSRSEPIRRTRSLRQGDPAAPDIFNAALDCVADEFCKWCRTNGYGIKLNSEMHLSLLFFADNFWLLATSPQMLEAMTQKWLDLLTAAGWEVPLEETTWCTTAPDEHHWKVHAQGSALPRSSRKVGFMALGVRLTFDNSFAYELSERISKAWRAFYKYRDLLCCKNCPMKPRLKLLRLLVACALFWCAGSWNLTTVQLAKLRGVQQAMIRKMLGLRAHDGETVADFCERHARSVKHVLLSHGERSWDATYHRLMFSWAGHVQRIGSYDPQQPTFQVLHYKDWQWIQLIASQNSGNQLHCRKLHTWRWERPLYKFFQDREDSWEQVAANKAEWQQLLPDMVTWRCTHR